MQAKKLLVASNLGVFVIFFLERFLNLDERVDLAGRSALGAFELGGLAASLYLLSRGKSGNASRLDWLLCAFSLLLACTGLASFAISLFALYLIFRKRQDVDTKAAGTVAAAVAIQAVWAPLIFLKLSFILLQIDAGVVGWLESLLLPGAFWGGTVVYTPSGHNVIIKESCASFHNLSLASLCWVTLTMLHRPYWVRGDLYVGLTAALIQFGFNICRLVLVCMSLPMYEFWHDGLGKHIFSGVATACAIIFVQMSLVLRDQQRRRPSRTANSAPLNPRRSPARTAS
jgi:hypothetical protein